MRRLAVILAGVWACSATTLTLGQTDDSNKNWAQWRGPLANGVAPHGDPPTEWNESKNIRWKVEVPGVGNATPIVWGDMIFLQTAIETEKKGDPEQYADLRAAGRRGGRGRPGAERGGRGARGQRPGGGGERGARGERGRRPGGGQRGERGQRGGRRGGGRGGFMSGSAPENINEFVVVAVDRKTGKTLWKTKVCEKLPHEGGHRDATQASNSPVTDGEHLYAFFGSRGLYCLDMKGKVLWNKDLGLMQTAMSFGEGVSPALYKDTLVVNWDHQGDSYIVALDKKTGKERWKVERDEGTSWATPLILAVNGKPQVVAAASKRIRSYDLEDGKLLWECGGLTRNVIPSPVAGNGLFYAISGFRGSALLAIRYASAQGDITGTPAVAWEYDGRGTPYVPSPLLYDDKIYFLSVNRAILSCVDAKNGKKHYNQQRLEGLEGVYASPVGADARVYIVGRNGATAVIKHGDKFELLATNTLDDRIDASPVIVGDQLFLRGRKHLYCIAEN